jgi:hypothetical protein
MRRLAHRYWPAPPLARLFAPKRAPPLSQAVRRRRQQDAENLDVKTSAVAHEWRFSGVEKVFETIETPASATGEPPPSKGPPSFRLSSPATMRG